MPRINNRHTVKNEPRNPATINLNSIPGSQQQRSDGSKANKRINDTAHTDQQNNKNRKTGEPPSVITANIAGASHASSITVNDYAMIMGRMDRTMCLILL